MLGIAMLVALVLVSLLLLSSCVVIKEQLNGKDTDTGQDDTVDGTGSDGGTVSDGTTVSDGERPAKDCEGVIPENCPMYAPPSPGWCSDGVITPRGFDENCCRAPPTCVRPDVPITREQCESARGHFNECGSACRTATEETACTLQCVQYCECGGIAGFGCPEGYTCTDYMPPGAADAMGVCKKL